MSESQAMTLRECVAAKVERYLQDLGAEVPQGLHARVMEEVERALLAKILEHCEGQKGLAAQWLGINRNTLSKKIQNYGLDR